MTRTYSFRAATIACALAVLVRAPGAQTTIPGRGAAAAAAAPSGPIVKTKDGPVQGVVTSDVNVFRGMPFAAPPIGDLRWRPPRPAASWTAVRATTAPGASCATAEDCLYLNVFRPISVFRTRGEPANQGLPVMVWIHGGAFTAGTGASYDGTSFARQGIVVVTITWAKRDGSRTPR
jgi:para-nitrobenzyl esterase